MIYPAPDLDAAKAWWTGILGIEQYFDEPFYVGYNVAGYELGLLPDGAPTDGALIYWGVEDVVAAVSEALAAGATEHAPIGDVGGGSSRRPCAHRKARCLGSSSTHTSH